MPLEQPPLNMDHGDKILHLLAYLALGLLLERAYPDRFLPWGAAGLILYSGIIELVQQQTGYRSGSWGDMLANGAGVALVLLVRPLLWQFSQPRNAS